MLIIFPELVRCVQSVITIIIVGCGVKMNFSDICLFFVSLFKQFLMGLECEGDQRWLE